MVKIQINVKFFLHTSLWLRLHNFDIRIEKLKVETFTDFLLILSSWIQLSHIIRYPKVSNTEEY